MEGLIFGIFRYLEILFFLFFRLSRSLIVMMQATLKSKVSSLHLHLLQIINILAMSAIACRQALWGALAAGREKEGELAITMRNADWRR